MVIVYHSIYSVRIIDDLWQYHNQTLLVQNNYLIKIIGKVTSIIGIGTVYKVTNYKVILVTANVVLHFTPLQLCGM